jgi:ABC-2 type transport system ATP-binding protein
MKENKVIEINHINKSYGGKRVLKDVSFTVKPGTIHGFIGPNGAGKTTTLSIIMRLVLPNGGDVKVDGKSVAHNPSFNQDIGFIPAEPRFPSMRVEDYALDCGYLRDISRGEVLQKISSSPLAEFRYKYCHELSTGWKKFLQLFVLSLYRPKIIIADEPANGLDPSFRAKLSKELDNVRKRGGTVLFSTHILADLQKLADDITMIKKGKIVYSGIKTADIEKTYEEYFIDKSEKGLFEL